MSETLQAPVRPALANFVGGEWLPSRSGETYGERSPIHPTRRSASSPPPARRTSMPPWPRPPRPSRRGRGCRWLACASVLTKGAAAVEARVEDMAQDMTLEMGKPLREARMEAARTAAIFRYFAGEACGRSASSTSSRPPASRCTRSAGRSASSG